MATRACHSVLLLVALQSCLLARARAAALPPGEIWSAFFAFNTTNACAADSVDARFYAARFSPAAPQPEYRHYVSEPYSWPSLTPIHSKTLTFQGGDTMAADPVGRRAWALFGTTDWSPHTWVVQLSFPSYRFNSTRVAGVCEIVNASMTPYQMMGLTYSPSIVKGGGAYFLQGDPAQFYSGTVTVVRVPPLNPSASTVPPCVLMNVSTVVSTGAFSPFILPTPVRGTDRRGNPLLLVLKRNTGNSSEIAVQVWSALSGALVYNVTWACGYPSYLYSCPPTNAGIPDGLNGVYLVNGILFFGGGPWSSQMYWQGVLPALADAEGGDDGVGDDASPIPVFTFVNSSSNQGTWLTSNNAQLFTSGVGQSAWPLTVQFVSGGSGTCTTPYYSSQMITTTISRDGATVTSTPFGVAAGSSPSCPLRQSDIPTWFSTAACAGSSYAIPDDLLQAV